MKKTFKKVLFMFSLLLLLLVIKPSLIDYDDKIVEAQSKEIEFYLTTYDNGERNITKEKFTEYAYENDYYVPITLMARSLKGNEIDLRVIQSKIDILIDKYNNYEIEKMYGQNQPGEIVGPPGREQVSEFWNLRDPYDPSGNGVINAFFMTPNANYDKSHPGKNANSEGIEIAYFDIIMHDFTNILDSLNGFEIKPSFDFAESTLANDQGAMEKDLILTSPLIIGNPQAGPSAELSSIEITGENKTYLNKIENITPDREKITNITYKDSQDGLKIDYTLKSTNAEVQSIKLHRGGSELRDITDTKNTGKIKVGDEIRIAIKDGSAEELYIIEIDSIIDASDNTDLKTPVNTNLDNDTSGKIKSKSLDGNTYTITVDYTVNSIKIHPEAYDDLSTININEYEFNDLTVGNENKLEVKITSESGIETKYDILINREEPSNDTDFDVTVNNNNVIKSDNKFEYKLDGTNGNYYIILKNLVHTASYKYFEGETTSEDPNDFISFGGNYQTNGSLDTGENITYTVLAKAQNNSFYLYYINITREKSDDTSIDGIEIEEGNNGLVNTLKNGNDFEYEITNNDENYLKIYVNNKKGQTVTITNKDNETIDINENIDISNLTYGKNEFNVIVIAQNGVDKQTYKLNIIKLSTNNNLESILLYDDNSKDQIKDILDFDKINEGYYDLYKITISYNEATKIRVQLRSSNYSKFINLNNNNISKENSLDIYYTFTNNTVESFESNEYLIEAQNKNYKSRPFKIVVIRESAQTDDTLNSIIISDNPIENFNPINDGPYNVLVSRDTPSVHIDYELPENSRATVKLIANNISNQTLYLEEGASKQLIVKVVSESGASREYIINIITKSDENEIDNIEITNTNESQFVFSKTIYDYDFIVPYTTSEIDIIVTSSEHSNVTNTGLKQLEVGKQYEFIINATSEAGTKSDITYTIRVKRNSARSFKDLESLTFNIDGNNMIDVLNDETQTSKTNFVYNYNRTVNNINISALINGSKGEYFKDGQNASNNQITIEEKLNKGKSNIYKFVVKDEKGDEKTYTLTINVFEDNTKLDNIVINNKEYTLDDFSNNILDIKEDVLHNVESVNFLYELNGSYSTLEIKDYNNASPSKMNKTWLLLTGENIFRFYIKAEDESESVLYTIKINKLAPNNNKELEELKLTWDDTTYVWDKESETIDIRVNRDVEKINLYASVLSEHRSKITGLGEKNIESKYIKYEFVINKDTNNKEFYVVAENGDQQKYTIRITRKNIETEILNVKIINKENKDVIYDGAYIDGEIKIDSLIPYHIDLIEVIVTKKDKYTKIYINNNLLNNELIVSKDVNITNDGFINIIVETDFSENDLPTDKNYYKKHEMVIEYEKSEPRDYRNLDSLNIYYIDAKGNKVDALENIFNSENRSYDLRLDRTISGIEIEGKTSNGANIISGLGDKILSKGNKNDFDIVVAAENTRTRTYRVTIYNQNDNSKIDDIKVNEESINFNEDILNYTIDEAFKYDTTHINLEVYLNDKNATYEIKNNKNLTPGYHTIEVVGISEYGTKSNQIYKINIKINEPYTNSKLDNLQAFNEHGKLISFDKDYNEVDNVYIIELNDDYDFKYINLITELKDNRQKITNITNNLDLSNIEIIKIAGKVNMVINFTVIAEGNNNQTEYAIRIVKDVSLSSNANIDDVFIVDSEGKNININFNKDIKDYEFNVDYKIDHINITINPEDSNALIKPFINNKINLNVGSNNMFEFYVIAEDGVTISDKYKINITRKEANTSVSLKDLTITDPLNDGKYLLGLNNISKEGVIFNSNKYEYVINLGIEYLNKRITIDYVKEFIGQTIEGNLRKEIRLNEGINEFEILVKAEDPNVVAKLYVININVKNKDNELSSLKINGDKIDLTNKENIIYETEKETANIIPELKNTGRYEILDKNNTLITEDLKLNYEDNEVTIKVYNDYGEVVEEINLIIKRNKDSNKDLISVTLKDNDNKNYLTNFIKNKYEYNVEIPETVEGVTLDIVTSPKATVFGDGYYNINPGETISIDFYVKAENGDETNLYVINVTRVELSKNNILDEIYFLDPLDSTSYLFGLQNRNPKYEFDPNTYSYTLNLGIEYDGTDINFRYLLGHNKQSIIGINNNTIIPLSYGENKIELIVHAENKDITPNKYVIIINVLYMENDLDELEINDEKVELNVFPIVFETEDEQAKINPILNNEYGSYEILDRDGNKVDNLLNLNMGDNKVTIIVKNENGDIVKEYEVIITRNKDSNNEITNVSLIGNDNENYLTNFDEDENEYKTIVPYNVYEVTLNAKTNPKAKLYGLGVYELIGGEEKIIEFYSVAQNGNKSNKYVIKITRELNTENRLEELIVKTNVETLLDSSNFEQENHTYYFQVNEDHNYAIFNYVSNYGQTVSGIDFNTKYDLSHGLNTFVINVKPEDKDIDSFKYTIEIEVINSKIDLNELNVNGVNVLKEGVFDYKLDSVSSDVSEINIEAILSDDNGTITINGVNTNDKNVSLLPGNNEIIIVITSEDGTEEKIYKIEVEQKLEDIDTLDELIIKDNNGNTLLDDSNFDKDTFEYSFLVNEDVESIIANYVLGSLKQTVSDNFNKYLDVNHGINVYKFKVYPEDTNLLEKTYKVTIEKINTNTKLNGLFVNDKDIYEEGVKDYLYEEIITTDQKYVEIIPKLVDNLATYEIYDNNDNLVNGNDVKLTFGNNVIKVIVIAEDGITKEKYTIEINQEYSNDNSIINASLFDTLTLSNKLNFDKDTYKYQAEFSYSTKKIRLRVETHEKAKVYIDGQHQINTRKDYDLIAGEYIDIEFYVEAENGDTGNTYSIRVYRRKENEAVISDNTNLFDVTIEIPMNIIPFNFDPNVYEYKVNIDYKYDEIYVKGHPEHKGAVVDQEGAYKLDVGKEKVIYLRVIAEDGTVAPKPYKITFMREKPNNDTTLKDLIVEDLNGNKISFDQKDFDSDNRTYYIKLDEGNYVNEVNIVAIKNHLTQTILNDGNVSLKGELEGVYNTVITISVVAESGDIGEYTIYILHDLDFSSIAEIKDISIIGDDGVSYFGSDFDKSKTYHEIIVPYYLNETKLIVQTLGNIIYLDENNNEIDDNRLQQFNDKFIIYRFKVRSQNLANESNIYEIKVIREDADSDALLETLMIDGKEILGFDPNKNNYTYVHPITMSNEIDLVGVARSDTSEVSGSKTYLLKEGKSNFITIVVKAQDGTTNTYTVEVKYVDSNALLGELTIYEVDKNNNEFENPVELEDGVFEYIIVVDREAEYVNIKGSAIDKIGARIRGFGKYKVGTNDLMVPIVVTSGDGEEEITYLITISKNYDFRTNSDLEYIKIDNVNIENFVFNKYNYYYDVNNKKDSVNLSLKTKDGNATIYVNDEKYDNQALLSINDLKEGSNAIIIKVVAEDGLTTSYYTLTFDKEVAPSLLLTILLILSLLLWIITILILIIKRNINKNKFDRDELIF